MNLSFFCFIIVDSRGISVNGVLQDISVYRFFRDEISRRTVLEGVSQRTYCWLINRSTSLVTSDQIYSFIDWMKLSGYRCYSLSRFLDVWKKIKGPLGWVLVVGMVSVGIFLNHLLVLKNQRLMDLEQRSRQSIYPLMDQNKVEGVGLAWRALNDFLAAPLILDSIHITTLNMQIKGFVPVSNLEGLNAWVSHLSGGYSPWQFDLHILGSGGDYHYIEVIGVRPHV